MMNFFPEGKMTIFHNSCYYHISFTTQQLPYILLHSPKIKNKNKNLKKSQKILAITFLLVP